MIQHILELPSCQRKKFKALQREFIECKLLKKHRDLGGRACDFTSISPLSDKLRLMFKKPKKTYILFHMGSFSEICLKVLSRNELTRIFFTSEVNIPKDQKKR